MLVFVLSIELAILVLLLVNPASTGPSEKMKRNYHKPYTLHPLERPIHILERSQLRKLKKTLRGKDIRIGGFYHIGPALDYWQHVIQEQLMLLDGYYTVPRHNVTYYEASNGAFHRVRLHDKGDPVGTGPGGVMALAEDIFIGLHGTEESRSKVQQFILSLNLSYIDRVQFQHRNAVGRNEFK